MAVAQAPGLDRELPPLPTGLAAREERALRIPNDAVRGVVLVSGATRDARARAYRRAAGEWVLESAPQPTAGQVVLTLTGVSFAGETPFAGTLAIDPASNLSPAVTTTICFARRAAAGALLTGVDLQCHPYPAGSRTRAGCGRRPAACENMSRSRDSHDAR